MTAEPTAPAQPAPTPAPASTPIVADRLPCLKCWYDLRGIAVTGRCPECGTTVSKTRRSLFASDPAYLRGIRASLRLAALACIGGLALTALGMYFAVSLLEYPDMRGMRWMAMVIVSLTSATGPVLAAFALTRAFRAERRLRKSIELPHGQAVSKGVLVVHAVATPALFAAAVCVQFPGGPPIGLRGRAAAGVAICAAIVAWSARNYMISRHIRRMGHRLGIRRKLGWSWLAGTAVGCCICILFMREAPSISRFDIVIVRLACAFLLIIAAVTAPVRHVFDLLTPAVRISRILRFLEKPRAH